jgi:hypothetical protein
LALANLGVRFAGDRLEHAGRMVLGQLFVILGHLLLHQAHKVLVHLLRLAGAHIAVGKAEAARGQAEHKEHVQARTVLARKLKGHARGVVAGGRGRGGEQDGIEHELPPYDTHRCA